jgi:hypothetical protein
MSIDSAHDNEAVGYGKPPKHSQFRPGHSGNPGGRPKGLPNISSVLSTALNERVVIVENGVRRTITKMHAAIKQLANKAAGGDGRATKLLLELMREYGEPVTSAPRVLVIQGADARL